MNIREGSTGYANRRIESRKAVKQIVGNYLVEAERQGVRDMMGWCVGTKTYERERKQI